LTTKREIVERLEWLLLQEEEYAPPQSTQAAWLLYRDLKHELKNLYSDLRELKEDIKRDLLIKEIKDETRGGKLGTVDGKLQGDLLDE
jgi:hypothetical protein